MKTEKQIWKRLDKIEVEIDNGGDFRSLESERDALNWVLEVNY